MNNMIQSISVSQGKPEAAGHIREELEKLCDPEYIPDIPDEVDPAYVELLPWLGPGMPKYRIIAIDTTFFLDRVILPHGWELVCPFELVYPKTEIGFRYLESVWALTHNGYVCHSFLSSDSGRTELWEGIKDFLARVETAEVFADIRYLLSPGIGGRECPPFGQISVLSSDQRPVGPYSG